MTALQEQRAAAVLAVLLGPEATTMAATVAEIAEACRLPTTAVRRTLRDLYGAGRAERTGGFASTGAECWVATAKARAEAQEAAEASG